MPDLITSQPLQDTKPIGFRRFTVGILLMLVISIAYIDRINLSIAGPVIAKEGLARVGTYVGRDLSFDSVDAIDSLISTVRK